MKNYLMFAFLALSIILVTNFDSSFAANPDSGNDAKMGHFHKSHMGICAPGFTSLDGMCVLDDRCGPGAYPGKVCMMDGKMKEYLRPHQQKYAGISVENIICAEGKQLMFKHHDASPACVNSDSVEKLEQRGWQTEKPVLACTLEYAPVCGVDGITYGNMCALNSEHMALKNKGECVTEIEQPEPEGKEITVELSESIGLKGN